MKGDYFMKTMIGTIALALTLNTAEASFNRFWIGYKLDSVPTAQFMNGLNQKLLPNLIKLAAGKGLVSYAPFVTEMNEKTLPAEIALITYQNEEIYKSVRSTPEGQAYSDLHWDLFDKATSKSTVPVQFQGKLEEGNAYELNAKFEGWQKGETYLTIYKREKDLTRFTEAFAEMKGRASINNSIVLVTPEYIFEYRSMKNAKDAFWLLPLKMVSNKHLKKAAIGKPIGFNEGVNAQF
jgi:hypothetical protein